MKIMIGNCYLKVPNHRIKPKPQPKLKALPKPPTYEFILKRDPSCPKYMACLTIAAYADKELYCKKCPDFYKKLFTIQKK